MENEIRFALELNEVFSKAVIKAKARNRRLGIQNVFMKDGQITFENRHSASAVRAKGLTKRTIRCHTHGKIARSSGR